MRSYLHTTVNGLAEESKFPVGSDSYAEVHVQATNRMLISKRLHTEPDELYQSHDYKTSFNASGHATTHLVSFRFCCRGNGKND